MPTEREQEIKHIVAEVYTKVWDFCWTPIRFIAGIFLSREWLPRFAPWIIGACVGRWPERVPDDERSAEDREQIETIRRIRRVSAEFQRNK